MPSAPKPLPARDYLWQVLNYEPITGELTWKHRPQEQFKDFHAWSAWNGRYAGKAAGSLKRTRSGEYRSTVVIEYIAFFTHRIIWKMVTGEDPKKEVDHINGDQADNSWDNLREATSQQNKWNSDDKTNVTGFRGVKQRGNIYQAWIRIDGKKQYLGSYPTAQAAHIAYMTAAKDIHGDFLKD